MSSGHLSVDTGWSWVYLCGASIVMFLWQGIQKALAVLLPTLRDQFDTDTWTIGMMISLTISMKDFSALLVGALTTADDLRTFALVGGVICAVSLIASSFASKLLVLVILTSVVSGVLYAFVSVPSYTILGRHFDKYYPLATGVYSACGSIGVMVLAPLTQLLLTTYGWRNTLLLLGGLYLHLVVGALLFRSPDAVFKIQYAAIKSSEPTTLRDVTNVPSNSSTDTLSHSSTVSNLAKLTHPSKSRLDTDEIFGWMTEFGDSSENKMHKVRDQIGLSLLQNRSFVAVCIMMSCLNATWTGWIVYFVPNCLVKGLTPYQATFLVSAAGFSNLIGHFIYVPFVVRNIVSVRGCIYIAGILSTVALLVDKFAVTVTSISLPTLSFTLGYGVAYPLCDVLVKEAVGADMIAKAYGLRSVVGGVVRIIVGPVVGWIYDTTESYAIGYFLLAVIQATGVIALVVDQLLEKPEIPNY